MMKTMYKADIFCGVNTITKVDVIKETPKQVVVISTRWGGEPREIRETKNSQYGVYFNTWTEAHNFLVQRELRTIDALRSKLEKAIASHERVAAMIAPH